MGVNLIPLVVILFGVFPVIATSVSSKGIDSILIINESAKGAFSSTFSYPIYCALISLIFFSVDKWKLARLSDITVAIGSEVSEW